MIHAYDEMYLYGVMKNLAEAFDYAVNDCGLDIAQFSAIFVASGYAEQIQKGTPKFLVGLSGTELAIEIITKSGLRASLLEPQIRYDCSAEYWCGYILAYYQWVSGNSFKDILEILTIQEIYKLYGTLHEASEEKFVEIADAIMAQRRSATKLQLQRKHYGYSQRELAERSGVNLRTLQQYESGAKDIRKAAVETVIALSTSLGCSIEDIVD